ISYQTNVNRQKTKKWTEAKPVDYGGDDWGDDDDYNLPPPPIAKSTGLRQPGQGLAGSSKAESPVVDSSRKYGDLPPLPGASNSRPRANSFDADDEKRDFSSSSSQPPPTSNAPATRFSQITGAVTPRNPSGPPALSISTQQPAQPPLVGLRNPSQVSPVAGSPIPDVLMPGPGRVNTGESSITSPLSDIRTPSTSSDFHARRDFSPSAVPPPLTTRASPGPQSATDATPSQRFPARKSSLSQVSGPPLDEIMGAGSQDTTPKPWIGARPASPGTGAKSPVSPSKALPFIRPADIYRRAEEERRQSIESAGRPSMDSLVGSKASDRSDSPSRPYTKGGSETGAARRRPSFENDEGSDSGRRLMPMLEPVKERKSEYGFDGFNVNDHGPGEIQSQFQEQSLQNRNLDVEDVRRQSTSPKLPDLTRISGFGMDMFAPKDVEAISKEPDTTPTTATLSSPEPDLTLRNQPSFGFKSVVHQAFDTADDHSLPGTPASRSGSGVNRTDSESTGTGGISPIMSRVSSTAVPETRNRDISTPAIMEATEPNSPETAANTGSHGNAFDAPQAPGFKPGHRRDISAPSPGNSPARTPDLATSHFLPGSQHAVVDDTPADVASPSAEEPLQTPRPFVDREHSFRPSLPGGWTSYATTARSETPTQPVVGTPVTEVTPAHDEDDNDLTPTTTKRSLPQTALAAFGGSPLSSPGSTTSPNGNMDPSQPLEASLPTLEQASPETQLRPDAVDRPVSTQSIPPPPPPKDTPSSDVLGESSDYFPRSAIATAEKTQDGFEAEHTSQSPIRPQVIPTLSPDSADYDEENDKLRNEIVKSLTSTPSNATAHTTGALSDRMDESSLNNPNRESSYLPSEYDNYWATTDQDEAIPTIPDVHRDASDAPLSTASTSHPGLESPVPAPLSPRRPDESLHPPRPPLQSRFSWEQSSEDVSAGLNRDQGYLAADTTARGPMASELPGSVVPVEEEKQVAAQSPEPTTAGAPSEDHHGGRDVALLAGGAALVGGVAAVTYSDRPEEKSRRLSLAEEKDPRVSSNPVSPTPPEDEHPSRSPQQHFPTSPEFYQHPPAPPSTVSPVTSSVHPFAPPPATAGRLIAFREIVAMKSPQERIKTFDETRHRFAAMDSGLNDWIAKLQRQFPEEHGGVTGSWGSSRSSIPSGSARGRFSKSSTAGGPAPPLQQPYYQQYLNASSPPAPSTPVSGAPRPGPSMPSGSQQGFSSASSKMTTQQVQAKGKELLHTAGIFGGKAGKAGKGLLAKGKNKLRAAGGGDKTSPPSKPKADRRSSWGLPLSISRSSGRPDAMSRNSRECTPTSTLNRPRTNTMPSEGDSPAPQLPAVSTGYSLGVMIPDLETRDILGVPAPIGKNQPSWDPFNATPIAEEDGFQYEERPKPRLSSDPSSNPDGLSVPADNLATSDRSNSSDAPFFDAHGKDLVAGASVSNPQPIVAPAVTQSLDKPTTSILDRPRGSFSQEQSPLLPVEAKGEGDVRASVDARPTSILDRSQAQAEKQSGASSFLPPIRRTSTFGIGFGSRQPKQRFAIEEDDEASPPRVLGSQQQQAVSEGSRGMEQPGQESDHSPDNILQRPEFKESQVEWRPNRPRVVTKPAQSSYSSESYSKEMAISAARTNSWDTQPPPRGYSGSSSYMQRQDSQFSEKGSWASPQQSKPFEQPPSSAQRYPELFKPGQQQAVVESPRDADLPAHYYQAPISRTQAFLPRQQTNEYQLPGVGPPEEPPVNPSRRNSGFLRDIGGRLSRASSRERRNSISRDQDRLSPERGLESRGEYAESSVLSDDGQEQKKRRASFFGHLSRNSYSGQSPPKSRESVIAHHAGSRTDLMATPQPSPVKRSFFSGSSSEQKSAPKKLIRQSTTGTMDSPAKKKEKNRFSALGGFFGKPSPSTKAPVQQHPQATRELSYNERQPIESPQPEQQHQRAPSKYQTPDKAQARAESQSRRGVLSKLSSSVAPPAVKEKEKSRRPSAAGLLNGFMGRKSYQKERGSDDSRSQGSQPQVGPQPLLSQTYTDLQEPEPPSQRQRQESPFHRQSQDQQYLQQQQVQSRSQLREIPFQDPSLINQDRGRRVSREPQYDSVPIPGGYSLVRGQGAMAVPTEYDPRGLSHLQQQQSQQQVDPRYNQSQVQYQSQPQTQKQGSRLSYQSANLSPQGQGQQQAYSPQHTEQPRSQQPLSHPQPQLGALETYRDYTNSNRRISREDILARSPPKPLIDQQRPYQISLPGGEIEHD
ncbi:hypothetical protein BKA61DRAFT_419100, partial [Leptodontidium sp. MPI-SDFR-AT-0119]